MSVRSVHRAAESATAAAIDACWRQWRTLGFPAAGGSEPEPVSIIDPEALVALSSAATTHERRLEDALVWWARTGATLLSVQRTTSLLNTFPTSARDASAPFAREAHEAGDRRWKRYAGENRLALGRRPKEPETPTLSHPTALMLRLRAGFGVGTKTDLFAYLLARSAHGATIKEARTALYYTAPALRTAATDMALAELIRPIQNRPVRYVADGSFGKMLLNESKTNTAKRPAWHDLAPLFTFLAHVMALAENAEAENTTPYVLSSRARDILLPLTPVFVMNKIDIPNPASYKGENFLEWMEIATQGASQWLAENS